MKKTIGILVLFLFAFIFVLSGCKKEKTDTKNGMYTSSQTMKGCSDESKQTLTEKVNASLEEKTEEKQEEEKLVFSDFEVLDINGNMVTGEIFKPYDVTMINVWKTWCQYCIAEMPGIQKLYEQRPENINIISICMDGDDQAEVMRQQLNYSGVTYTTLIPSGEMLEELEQDVLALPTTYFVDAEGQQLITKFEGTPARQSDNPEAVAQGYMNLISLALVQVKK